MNSEVQGKVVTGLFGGILLMFVMQFLVLNVWNSYVSSHQYQYFVFLPFILLVFMVAALLWLLERMSR